MPLHRGEDLTTQSKSFLPFHQRLWTQCSKYQLVGRGRSIFNNNIFVVVRVNMEYLKNGLLLIFRLHFYKDPKGWSDWVVRMAWMYVDGIFNCIKFWQKVFKPQMLDSHLRLLSGGPSIAWNTRLSLSDHTSELFWVHTFTALMRLLPKTDRFPRLPGE